MTSRGFRGGSRLVRHGSVRDIQSSASLPSFDVEINRLMKEAHDGLGREANRDTQTVRDISSHETRGDVRKRLNAKEVRVLSSDTTA